MKKIWLSNMLTVLVDDNDYEELSQYNWGLIKKGRSYNQCYARRTRLQHESEDLPKFITMHRQIMGFPDGYVDHIDGDGLDNRRENLRIVTPSQNTKNMRNKAPRGSVPFHGVSFDKQKNKYRAEIHKDNKRHYLGHYKTAEEAAQAYNDKAIELHGEYATLNEL